MVLLQGLRSPPRMCLNIIIALYIFFDGLIHVKILKHFNLMLDQKHLLTLLILSDIPYFDVNEV